MAKLMVITVIVASLLGLGLYALAQMDVDRQDQVVRVDKLTSPMEVDMGPGYSSWPDTIRYDNGYIGRYMATTNTYVGVRFTPIYDFNLYSMYFAVINDPSNTTDGCSLFVATDDGTGKPNWPATFVGTMAPPLLHNTLMQFDLAGPIFFQAGRDFHLIYGPAPGGTYPAGGWWAAFDSDSTFGERTNISPDYGTTWPFIVNGDAIIRAGGIYSVPAGQDTLSWRTLLTPNVNFGFGIDDSFAVWFDPPAPCQLYAVRIRPDNFEGNILVDVFETPYGGNVYSAHDVDGDGYISDGTHPIMAFTTPLAGHLAGPVPRTIGAGDAGTWLEISFVSPVAVGDSFCVTAWTQRSGGLGFSGEDEGILPFNFFKYYHSTPGPDGIHTGWFLRRHSLDVEAIVDYGAPQADVVINEIRIQPFPLPDNSDSWGKAWIELYNKSNMSIDITGWTIANRTGSTIANLPSWLLPGNGFLMVYFGQGMNDNDFSDDIGSYYTQGDSIGIFESAEDECALFTGIPDMSTLIDFVGWSSEGSFTGGIPAQWAISSGLWTSGDFVDSYYLGLLSTIGLLPSGYDHNEARDWHYFGWGESIYGALSPGENPMQLRPQHGVPLEITTVNFSWREVSRALSYRLEVDDDSSFISPVVDVTTSDTSYTTSPLADGFYWWRVKVNDSDGLVPEYAAWEFDVSSSLQKGEINQLGVPHYLQHKDTRLLCITDDSTPWRRPGCAENTDFFGGPWDAPHPNNDADKIRVIPLPHFGISFRLNVECPHCRWYCARASAQMINHFYGGDLSQDRISYEYMVTQGQDRCPNAPEGDLGHDQGTSIASSTGVLRWCLPGATVAWVTPITFAAVQAEITAGFPVRVSNGHHAMVVDGARIRAGRREVHLLDPWPTGTSGWRRYNTLGLTGFFRIRGTNINGRKQETSVTTDTDGDGVMDFDEGYPDYPYTNDQNNANYNNNRPRRFECRHNDVDTDDDELHDKNEIRSYTFHDQPGHHPGHENDGQQFPDIDDDGLRAERDCDSDGKDGVNGQDFDGGEDIDGDGHNPERAAAIPEGENCNDRETCMFDVGSYCIKLHTDQDVYFLGEPVYIVDTPTRQTRTFHANSWYFYEQDIGCPPKPDSSTIRWDGLFFTDNMGRAITTLINYCWVPGEYYVIADVLDDHHVSKPDNTDPMDCYTCLGEWFHGWHWGLDYNYKYPYAGEWPYWEYPSVYIDYEWGVIWIDVPWWWWCYIWPPYWEYYFGISVPAHMLEYVTVTGASFREYAPEGGGDILAALNYDQSVTDSLNAGYSREGDVWIGYSIDGFELPDSQMVVYWQLSYDTSVVEMIGLDGYFTFMAGDAEFGWSPTVYDSIPISIEGDCSASGERCDDDNNGLINVLDVLAEVNIILGIIEPDPCQYWRADCNCDGNVNVLDALTKVNCILGLIECPPCNKTGKEPSLDPVRIHTPQIDIPGQQKERGLRDEGETGFEIPIHLDTEEEIWGLQLRLNYDPTVLTPEAMRLSERCGEMTVASNIKGDELIIVIYSTEGKVVPPGLDPLLNVPFKTSDSRFQMTDDLIRIEEVILVGENCQNIPVQIEPIVFRVLPVPTDFALEQNYPNPFNPITDIRYQIPENGSPVRITMKVYNVLGQEIRTLIDEPKEAGYYTVTWDGRDDAGQEAASGVYFYRLEAGEFTATKRMVLLK